MSNRPGMPSASRRRLHLLIDRRDFLLGRAKRAIEHGRPYNLFVAEIAAIDWALQVVAGTPVPLRVKEEARKARLPRGWTLFDRLDERADAVDDLPDFTDDVSIEEEASPPDTDAATRG